MSISIQGETAVEFHVTSILRRNYKSTSDDGAAPNSYLVLFALPPEAAVFGTVVWQFTLISVVVVYFSCTGRMLMLICKWNLFRYGR